MKPDKKIQEIIIYFLICVILAIGSWGFNYYKDMKHVINHSIYSNLYTAQHILRDINDEFVKYDNKQITNNELHNLISENRSSLFITTYTTEKYEYISKRLEYVDICELGDYIDVLAYTDLSDEELEYHIKNVQEIYKLLNRADINLTDNYFKPSKRLKKTLGEINTLSEKGYNQISNNDDNKDSSENIELPVASLESGGKEINAAFYKNGFNFEYDKLPILTLSGEEDVLQIALSDDFGNNVEIGEDYYKYTDSAVFVEKETYELIKDENNIVSFPISRRGNVREEQAVYFIKNDEGTFVFKVVLPIDGTN